MMAILIVLCGRTMQAQCPTLYVENLHWAADMPLPDADKRLAIVEGIRATLLRYCEVADLTEVTGNKRGYSEEKDLAFQDLFRDGGLVYNDLLPDWGQRISPDEYRNTVRNKLHNSGVDFQLDSAMLEQIWESGGYYRARLTLKKTMFNGLNKRKPLEEVGYKRGKEPVIPLIMELRLLALSDGAYGGVITSLAHALPKTIKPTIGRFLDVDLAGFAGMPLRTEAAYPWRDEDLGTGRHLMLQAGAGYAHPLGSSDRWYGLAGVHIRQGWLSQRLDEDIAVAAREEGRTIGSRTYDVPYDRRWTYSEGGTFHYRYLSVAVPLGVRFIPRPNLFRSWIFDLQVMPGWSWITREYQGDLVLEHGYGGHLDCRFEVSGDSEGLSDRWSQPAMALRFSPGYYRQIPSLTRTNRSVGWFLRMDAEAGILPLIRRNSDAAWITLDESGMPFRNAGAGMLYRSYLAANLGLRAGIYWKIF